MSSVPAVGKASRAAAAMVALSMINGCYATFDIPVMEAPRLADSSPVHEVRTSTGGTRSLSDSFKATVVLQNDYTATFQAPLSSEIRGGVLLIQGQRNPVPVPYPLNWISTIRIRQISPGGTAGAVIGIVAGGVTAFVLFGLLLSSTKLG